MVANCRDDKGGGGLQLVSSCSLLLIDQQEDRVRGVVGGLGKRQTGWSAAVQSVGSSSSSSCREKQQLQHCTWLQTPLPARMTGVGELHRLFQTFVRL